MKEKVKVFSNTIELNNFAAQSFVGMAVESIAVHGRFTVALAGGSTPKVLYRLLASDMFRARVDWSRIFFFFGDERNVLPDNDESNFRMANENLFEPLKIKSENIFRWQTELKDPEKISTDYEATLKAFFSGTNFPPSNAAGSEIPRFDLILLGMGADGHTASLFPFSEALHETEKIAVANYVEKLQTTRLTLTFPTINNAANVIFLVAGAEKVETLKEVLEGEFQPLKFPSQNVRPKNGELLWLIDAQCGKIIET